jgi:hypothetical protein
MSHNIVYPSPMSDLTEAARLAFLQISLWSFEP